MSHIQPLPYGRFRARYRDAEGHEHAKHFVTRAEAERWAADAARRVAAEKDARREPVTAERTAWDEAIGGFLALLAAGGAAENTIRNRKHYLSLLRRSVGDTGPWDVTRAQLIAFMGRPGWKPATRKCARSAVISMYAWAEDERHVARSPAYRLPSVRVPDGVPKPTPDDAFESALSRAGSREVLMLKLGAWAGLRRAEIAAVHAVEIGHDDLRVTGKGGRTRLIPLDPEFAAELRETAAGGFLFPGDHQKSGHVAPNYVGILLKRLLGTCSAHTLRHRFASRAYGAERDLRAVQTLLGHSKPETTAIYTQVPDGALRTAVQAAWR